MESSFHQPGADDCLVDDEDEDEEISFNATKDGVELEDIEDDTSITFLVPHSDASALTAMVCLISLSARFANSLSC